MTARLFTGILVVGFFALMLIVGLYCRRHATDVNGFVLGGRNVGPWLTAFAYGTSYFSAVIFVGYAGSVGTSVWLLLGSVLVMHLSARLLLGMF